LLGKRKRMVKELSKSEEELCTELFKKDSAHIFESKKRLVKKNVSTVHFKLQTCNHRFELVYKNLLRDVRKSFWKDFSAITDFNSHRRRMRRSQYYI
jgi:hypothetical protein